MRSEAEPMKLDAFHEKNGNSQTFFATHAVANVVVAWPSFFRFIDPEVIIDWRELSGCTNQRQ